MAVNFVIKIKGRIFKVIKKTVAGNALIITIVFAIIIGILSSALILLAYYNRTQHLADKIKDQLARNAQSGIVLLLDDTVGLSINSKRQVDLYGHQSDSLEIATSNWGLFKVGIVRSFEFKMEKTRQFLYGEVLPSYFNAAIYLADHERPLALVGTTKVTGNAYLPKAGVQVAYIDQRKYNRDSLIFGQILVSEKALPALDSNIFNYLTELIYPTLIKNNSEYETLFFRNSLKRSFRDSSLIINQKGQMTLRDSEIDGNIIIHSDSLIEVDQTCTLKNCILTAPVIRLKRGFSGTIQLMATDSIIIEQDCQLRYPSAVILLKVKNKTFQPIIIIGTNSEVEGAIVSLTENVSPDKTAVYLKEGSKINGLVYVDGFLSLKGKIEGSAGADFFLYNTSLSMFQNYLVDAEINRSALSASFVGPVIFKERTKRKVITWLNN